MELDFLNKLGIGLMEGRINCPESSKPGKRGVAKVHVSGDIALLKKIETVAWGGEVSSGSKNV